MLVDINNLSGGALLEKMNIELRKIAENVLDPNTKPDAVRTLTVTIKIKPNETRQIGAAEIQVKSSLAPSRGIPTSFVFDFDHDGKAVLKELAPGATDPNQLMIGEDSAITDGTGKVINARFR